MTDARTNLQFNVLRNAIYHTGRRMTLERWNRWCNFVTILLGATAMTDVLRNTGIESHQFALGGAVAAVSAAQLVFDFGGKARDHQSLQRDYYGLLADIEEVPEASDEQVAVWRGKMIRIAGDEPPTLRALDAKAYNDAIGATEIYGMEQRLVIPIWHRLTGWILPFEGHNYEKVFEKEDRLKAKAEAKKKRKSRSRRTETSATRSIICVPPVQAGAQPRRRGRRRETRP